MSLDSWIIDEVERDRDRSDREGNRLELPYPREDGAPLADEEARSVTRGVTIVDISPTADNVISI